MSLVITKASIALKSSSNNVEVIKFESYKLKKKSPQDIQEKLPQKLNKQTDLDLKKIRHEVLKLGMSGFDGTKKEEAKIALAVSLGARPPKNKYLNYKELMKKRKDEKQKATEEKKLMMSKTVLQSGNKKKKNPAHDVGHILSSYGKVQKKDLKKEDKGSKKKKTKL